MLLGRKKKEKKAAQAAAEAAASAEEQRQRALQNQRAQQQQQQQQQQLAMSSTTPAQKKQTVPKDYFECEMPTLIHLLSSMLSELVELNDALPFDADNLTRFHSRSPPGISIYDYMVRMVKFCTLEKSVLLSIIYYIDLLCTTYSTFNINSLTVHRFMITAAMVGSKGLCDSFCTNSHYAKVGGLSRVELNLLEVEFLVRVDYKIVPKVYLLSQYYQRMVGRLSNEFQFNPHDPEPYQQLDTPSNLGSLPSELAHQEERHDRSSALKRPSITEVIPNAHVHHPNEPKSTPLIASPKRTKH